MPVFFTLFFTMVALFLGQLAESFIKMRQSYLALDLYDARQLRSPELEAIVAGEPWDGSGHHLPPCFDYCYQASLRKYCSLAIDVALQDEVMVDDHPLLRFKCL